MSAGFVGVQWNRTKVVYDIVAIAGIFLYVQTFQWLGRSLFDDGREFNSQILNMRAWGSCAFGLLTLILLIGPLARLDRRFLPLLYNRRHLGVMLFFVGLQHACEVLSFYHAYSVPRISELESLLTFDASFEQGAFPFQLFGAAALVYFAIMAATSHDLWQRFLGPRLWKTLHMGVYVAWAAVVVHVVFGALQVERHPVWLFVVSMSVFLVGGLHLLAGRREISRDRPDPQLVIEGEIWVRAGRSEDLNPGTIRSVCPETGERIALVRDGSRVSAYAAVCAHQGGPLDEGAILDGCLTCPWHGWQYRTEDGVSPPPFEERLASHRVAQHEDGSLIVKVIPESIESPAQALELEN